MMLFSFFPLAAATMRFDGTQHVTLYGGSRVTEAEDLSFRFHTLEKDALFVATRDTNNPDRLQITLGIAAKKSELCPLANNIWELFGTPLF